MNKRIVFRHMDHSHIIEEFANKHLEKIEHFLQNEQTPIYIDLVMEPSKTREHSRIELRVKTPNYDKVTHHESQGDKFYDTLADVIETMHRELLEEKRKLQKNDRRASTKFDEHKKSQ